MRFRPFLALSIAAIHAVLFVFIVGFVIGGSLSRATGPGGPSQGVIDIGEFIGLVMAPTLLIAKHSGVKSMDPPAFFITAAMSSLLYGILLSLPFSKRKQS